jgi:hypothetical protein
MARKIFSSLQIMGDVCGAPRASMFWWSSAGAQMWSAKNPKNSKKYRRGIAGGKWHLGAAHLGRVDLGDAHLPLWAGRNERVGERVVFTHTESRPIREANQSTERS